MIGHSLDAEVEVLAGSGEVFSVEHLPEDEWATLSIVSSFRIVKELSEGAFSWKDKETGIEFAVRKAQGEKCPRCWKRDPEVTGEGVCLRCAAVLSRMGKDQ
jgi:isoleucyl-tRNA synthetase